MANPRDPSADLTHRARSYLHANCAHCHRMHAGSSVLSQMQFDLPLDQTKMIDMRPMQGTFGIHAARVIAPGDPYRSVLLYRMSKLGSGRMPYIGSQIVDAAGVALIHQWIQEMPAGKTQDSAEDASASRLRKEERQWLEQLQATPHPASERTRLADQLLSRTSGALMLLRAVDNQALSAESIRLVVDRATSRNDVQVGDLYERFLPEEKGAKRLGSVIRPADILRLPGSALRGKQVFFETSGVQCKNCHRIGGAGREVGPDLTRIGKKYNVAQLLESVLEPSKSIDPKFVSYLVETKEGQVHTGLLVARNGSEVVLKDAQGVLVHIPADHVERIAGQSQSLMPELLLRDLTAQQVADSVAYLSSLQ